MKSSVFSTSCFSNEPSKFQNLYRSSRKLGYLQRLWKTGKWQIDFVMRWLLSGGRWSMRKMDGESRRYKSFDFVQNIAIISVQNINSSLYTMTTQIISLSEYRKNISIFTKQATEQNICFIITSHGKPVWEYRPLKTEDVKITTKYSQEFIDELADMERDYKSGNFSGPFNNTKELFTHLDSLWK